MSLEPSYRAGVFIEGIGPPELEELVDRGVLVPDTRLQDIESTLSREEKQAKQSIHDEWDQGYSAGLSRGYKVVFAALTEGEQR